MRAAARGFGLQRGLIRHRPPTPQGRFLALVGELDLVVVEAGSGALLDGHDDLPVAAAQVAVAVATGMQLGASPEHLAGAGGGGLAGMADEQDGGPEAALGIAQEAEDGERAHAHPYDPDPTRAVPGSRPQLSRSPGVDQRDRG